MGSRTWAGLGEGREVGAVRGDGDEVGSWAAMRADGSRWAVDPGLESHSGPRGGCILWGWIEVTPLLTLGQQTPGG